MQYLNNHNGTGLNEILNHTESSSAQEVQDDAHVRQTNFKYQKQKEEKLSKQKRKRFKQNSNLTISKFQQQSKQGATNG